jgi:hypothetical protein
MFTARSARRPQGHGREPSGAAGLWPSRTARHGHPILFEKDPAPPKDFPWSRPKQRANLLFAGLPPLGNGEGARMGGGRGGRNHRPLLPGHGERRGSADGRRERWPEPPLPAPRTGGQVYFLRNNVPPRCVMEIWGGKPHSVHWPQGHEMKPRGAPGGIPTHTAQHGHRFPVENGPAPPKVRPWDGSQDQKRVLFLGLPAWGTAQRGRREEGEAAGATTPHSLVGRKLPVLPVTGGRYGGARYPGGEWATRVSAYVVYNKCLSKLGGTYYNYTIKYVA